MDFSDTIYIDNFLAGNFRAVLMPSYEIAGFLCNEKYFQPELHRLVFPSAVLKTV